MGRDNHKGASNNPAPSKKKRNMKTGQMKEEISLELAELGNLNPLHEPMTQNNRKKSESEKTY